MLRRPTQFAVPCYNSYFWTRLVNMNSCSVFCPSTLTVVLPLRMIGKTCSECSSCCCCCCCPPDFGLCGMMDFSYGVAAGIRCCA